MGFKEWWNKKDANDQLGWKIIGGFFGLVLIGIIVSLIVALQSGDGVPDKNGSKLKIAALTAVGGLIIVIVTIMGFARGAVDERIDVKILAHEKDTEEAHQEEISEIQQDIAVMKVRQQQIQEELTIVFSMVTLVVLG